MVWVPEAWPDELKGFNVKRKAKDEDNWVQLNQSVIVPSSDQRLDVRNVTTSSAEEARLLLVYDSLVSNDKIPVFSESQMKEQFLQDADKIKFLKFLATVSFDFPLVIGYGFHDMSFSYGKEYQYAVFSVNESGLESQNPTFSVNWISAKEQKIDIPYKANVKKIRRKKGLVATWYVPTDSLDFYDVKGFHVYRVDSAGSRSMVTEQPIRVNMLEEEAPIIYSDPELDNAKPWAFEAVPVTIFDEEGTSMNVKSPFEYFPEDVSLVFRINETPFDQPLVSLRWEIESTINPFVKEFRVLRRENINEPADTIAVISDPAARTYSDGSVVSSGYYLYSAELVTTIGRRLLSAEKMVYKQLVDVPSTPQNLQGRVNSKGATTTNVYLSWLPVQHPKLKGYQLYTDGILSQGLAREGSIGIINQNSFNYPVQARYGKEYRFAISSVTTENIESELSDTISVFVPSKSLPQVNVWPISKNDGVVTLNWTYLEDIEDLQGFRIYENGQLVEEIESSERQWASNTLDGGRYTYEVEAFTRFGVQSKLSKPRVFLIEE